MGPIIKTNEEQINLERLGVEILEVVDQIIAEDSGTLDTFYDGHVPLRYVFDALKEKRRKCGVPIILVPEFREIINHLGVSRKICLLLPREYENDGFGGALLKKIDY